MKKGFTLFEIMAVMIIVTILASLALPAYFKSREIAYDNQAKADLKLISNAEKGYNLDTNTYYVPVNATQPGKTIEINNALGLGLPVGEDRRWDYLTDTAGCSQATRNGEDSRIWHMNVTDTEPLSGVCS